VCRVPQAERQQNLLHHKIGAQKKASQKLKKKTGGPPEAQQSEALRFELQKKNIQKFEGGKFGEVCQNMDSKAMQQFDTALAIYRGARRNAATTNEKIRSFYHPESFLRSRTSKKYALRPQSVRVLHPYRAPEQSAFCWGAVPCPFSPTGLAPWVLARMQHIRSMDYPRMQQQMLDFVDMVIDLSAQQRRKKRASIHTHGTNPELWPLFQVASECRQSVEFWLVFSTVLDYFSELPEQAD
jgi:hypothetical protein